MESTYPSLVYSILELLHQNSESMLFTDILNALSSTPGTDTLRILEFMITEKLISGKLAAYERIRITSRGIAELFAYREQFADKTENTQPTDTTDENIKPDKETNTQTPHWFSEWKKTLK